MSGMTDGDLFAPAPSGAAAQGGLDGTDADMLARLAVTEGDPNNASSWQNVAGVALNRAHQSGKTLKEVLSEPGQFESVGNGALAKVDPAGPQYKAALQAVQPVLSGKVDVPYDSFVAPQVLKARGQPLPAWANGDDGTPIGTQTFFSGKYQGAAPAGLTPAEQQTWASLHAPGSDKGVRDSSTGAVLPDIQAKAARALQATGDLVSGPTGATYKGSPFYFTKGNEQPERQGDYWLDPQGAIHQVPVDYNGAVNFANGGLLGFGNKLMAGVAALKASGGNPTEPMFGKFYDQALSHFDEGQQAYAQEHPVAAPLTTAAGNLTTVLPALAAGGEFLAPVRAALGPVGDFLAGASRGNKFLTTASTAANGAIQGAAASGMTAAQSDRPFGEQVGTGAAGGAVLGPLANGAANIGRNLFLGGEPGAVSPAVADLAQTAVSKYGIPVRLSQIKGVEDRAARVLDSERVGTVPAYADNNAAQKTAFTQAVARTFGSDADRLTPDVMQSAKTRIGGVMNDVASRTNIDDTDTLLSHLGGIVHDAQQVLPDAEAAPLLKQVENIGSTIQNGQLSGSTYQKLVAKGSPLDKATESSNSNIRYYAQNIRDALDDALERSATPEDLKALQQARFQYKNLMTVKNLAAKANVEGEISPSLLNGAVNTSFKNRAFQGAGDLGELAQIGQTFMKEPPNSYTAERLSAKLSKFMPSVLGGAGVADLALAVHDPVLAAKFAAGTVAAAAARKGAQAASTAYNLSPTIRNRFLDASTIGNLGPSGGAGGAVPIGVLQLNRMLAPPQQTPAPQPNQ